MAQRRPAKASPCRDCNVITWLRNTPCHPPGWSTTGAFPWRPVLNHCFRPALGDTVPLSSATVTDFLAHPLWGGVLLTADVIIVLSCCDASLLHSQITATFYLRGSDSGSVHAPQMSTHCDNWGYGQILLPSLFLLTILGFLTHFFFPVFSGLLSLIIQSIESPGIQRSYLRNLKNF